MNEIHAIERVLCHKYGKEPRMVENTFGKRYINHIKSNHYLPTSLISGIIVYLIRPNVDAAYDGETHTIFVPPEGAAGNRFVEFSKYHELGHGYSRQRNPKFQELDNQFAKNAVSHLLGGKFSKELIENILLSRSVDEGVADYLAINSQKMQVEEGRDPREVYCFEREWMLVNFENPEEGRIFTESTPLSIDRAAELEEAGEDVIKEFYDANQKTGLKRVKGGLEAIELLKEVSYVLGHYLVRSACETDPENTGVLIDRIMYDVPKNAKELQRIVLENMS